HAKDSLHKQAYKANGKRHAVPSVGPINYVDEKQRRSCLLNNQRLRPWFIASILNPTLPISLRVFCNELHRNHDLGHESGSKPCWLAEHVTMDTQYIL
ncbi:SVP1-like protein, partial [Trichinella spiralis]